MQISRLLERKGSFVATVPPDALVVDVVRELSLRAIGALVVSEDSRSIVGIVSERDVVRSIAQFGPAILQMPVRAIMSDSVRTCDLQDSVDTLMSTMTEHRIRHVPVVSEGALVGIVSIGDVVKTRLDELEADRAALEQYITAR